MMELTLHLLLLSCFGSVFNWLMFAAVEMSSCLLFLAEVTVSFFSRSKNIFELLQQRLVGAVNSSADVCYLGLATSRAQFCIVQSIEG